MSLIVQKYGGTSVADLDRIANVAKRVARYRDEGHKLVVVVSAMAGETDRLISLAKQVTPDPAPRELDVLIATGEQVSVALLAMKLRSMGYKAKSYLAHQVKILTDDAFTKARIIDVEKDRILKDLEKGYVVIVAGFQGVNEKGDITTLGRGGSDTSAVALAAALSADLCEIYTDVDGVYTTDPNICSAARRLDKITYEEMLEMASLGAKVLQQRSVEFAKKYGVPLVVKSSFKEGPGTRLVEEEGGMEDVVVAGVTYDKSEAKISLMGVPDRPGVASRIFTPLSDANIVVDMIVQNVGTSGKADLTFTVKKEDYKRALDIIRKVGEYLGASRIEGDENISKVSIVGTGMRSHSGVASRMFSALANEGINIMMISTSEIKISCVIDEKYTELAVRVLHDAFGLGREEEGED